MSVHLNEYFVYFQVQTDRRTCDYGVTKTLICPKMAETCQVTSTYLK